MPLKGENRDMTEAAQAPEADGVFRLIAHRDGISPAASRGTTPDQETVLDVMRQAVRSDTHAV